MDIEKMSHSGYKVSVMIAIVLSCIVVTVAALLGRGTLNLKGSLMLDIPMDVTVIALVEPKLEKPVKISAIDFLRKEKRESDTHESYAYHIHTSDNENYLIRLGFNIDKQEWTITQFERLHGDPVTSDAV